VDHPENDRKDLFVDVAGGVPRPYYNAMLMQSMLPEVRYRASSDALDAHGIGVYGVAAASRTKIAVMTWNYQWTRETAYNSTIKIGGASPPFRESNVLVERYKVGNDLHSGGLRRVESFVVGARTDGSFEAQNIPLGPNELHLLVLTPTNLPIGTRL
jgi:hypothetical protein